MAKFFLDYCRSQPVYIHSYHTQTVNLIFKIIATKIKCLKQSKVQIIGILEEITSFYSPKMHFLKRCQKMGRATPCLRETVACCEHAKVSPQAKVGTSPFLNAALWTVWTDDVGALLWWFPRSRWWIFAAFDSQRSRYIYHRRPINHDDLHFYWARFEHKTQQKNLR